MIRIKKSQTADTRTCDFKTVSKETLVASSKQHIQDVAAGLEMIKAIFGLAQIAHDHDKLSGIDHFHADFVTGFEKTEWWDNHRKVNRHHLQKDDGVPVDVNLVDVIEMIVDCVMAGMARSGKVYDVKIDPAILQKAFDNTVELLKQNVEVIP